MADNLQKGTVLQGMYQVGDKIGEGGGGKVYRGYHQHLKTEIAIKKIHEEGNFDPDEVFREAEILTKLRHSNLPRIYDFLILDSGVYTVMDFIPGQSLEEMMIAGHKFTESEIVKYGTQLANVISYLHAQKPAVIHGDIKPANVMITPDDNICLIDFNISGIADAQGNAYVMGYSDGYAAPEQFKEYKQIIERMQQAENAWRMSKQNQSQASSQSQNQSQAQVQMQTGAGATILLNQETPDATVLLNQNQETVPLYLNHEVPMGFDPAPTMESLGIKGIHIDPKSDVYSIGATLYHLVTGKKITEVKPDENPTVSVSDGLVLIINKAMAPDPANRYQDAGELLKAFQKIYTLDKNYRRKLLRKQLLVSFLIVLLGAGIVGGVYGYTRLQKKGVQQYNECIVAMENAAMNGDTEGVERAFAEAISLSETELAAYVQMANYLYQMGEYDKVVAFVDQNVLVHSDLKQQDGIDAIYYLEANAYYEKGDFASAINAYQYAISLNANRADYYADYAISLANAGYLDDAQKNIQKAEEMGMDAAYLQLVQGELAKNRGDFESASQNFQNCIDAATDTYVIFRAYIFYSDIYSRNDATAEDYQKQISLLLLAMEKLPAEYQTIVRSRLAKGYMSLYGVTGETETARQAIETYLQIAESGMVDFAIYNNIVILYEQIQEYQNAMDVLSRVENLFGKYYAYYKRKAFLAFEMQMARTDLENIDFTEFVTCYEKAVELYQKVPDKNDPEMITLEQTYQNYSSILAYQ